MPDPAAAARHRELQRRLEDLLRVDRPSIAELLQRAGRRIERGQPSDRLLDQALQRLDEAQLRAAQFRSTLPVPGTRAICPSTPNASASSRRSGNIRYWYCVARPARARPRNCPSCASTPAAAATA
jgi:hypothetical protein